MATRLDEVELRVKVSRRLVQVLDAVAFANKSSRSDELAGILARWEQQMVHQTTLIQRIAGVNPSERV